MLCADTTMSVGTDIDCIVHHIGGRVPPGVHAHQSWAPQQCNVRVLLD